MDFDSKLPKQTATLYKIPIAVVLIYMSIDKNLLERLHTGFTGRIYY